MLCCGALKIHLLYSIIIYCAQEQELLSDYCGIYIQFCMSNSLHVAENFIKTVLLECINERYQVYHNARSMMTVLLEYTDCSIQFSTNA